MSAPAPAEIHELILKEKVYWLNYAVAIFAGIGSFLFGYDSGIISSVISESYTHFHEFFDDPNEDVLGAVVSLFAGGAFFGAALAGYTADKIGRKRTIQLGSLIALLGCGLQSGATNIGMLMGGRFIAGMAIGTLSMIVPLYQAEISPPHARGMLSGFTQLGVSFGFFVANWVGYGCGFLPGNNQWRVPLGIQLIPAGILFLGMFVLPYSPRWLAQKGRHEEALSSLYRLHGAKANQDVIRYEYDEICAQLDWERENVSSSFLDLFKTKPSFHRTACACMVQICCQFTGVNVNSYFAPTIYGNLGYKGTKPLLINGFSGLFGLIVTAIFISFVVDSPIGRRKPLIFGPIAMAVFLAWQTAIAAQFDKPGYANEGAGIAGIISIYLFSGAFSFSYGPVSWIYQSECISMPLRSMGTALATCCNWASNVLLSQVTPLAFKKLGWRYFIVYICTNCAIAVLGYFLYPETKGKTLEELGAVFGDDNVTAPPGYASRAAGNVLGEKEKMDDASVQHVETHTA